MKKIKKGDYVKINTKKKHKLKLNGEIGKVYIVPNCDWSFYHVRLLDKKYQNYKYLSYSSDKKLRFKYNPCYRINELEIATNDELMVEFL